MSWKDIWRPLLENLEQGFLPQNMDLGRFGLKRPLDPGNTGPSIHQTSQVPVMEREIPLSIALHEFFWLV